MKIALCLTAFVLTLGAARAQTTWHVDAAGNAPGSGTQSDPYTSIQYAAHQPTTHSGDTILVGPGTYVENVITDENLALYFRSTQGPAHTKLLGALYFERNSTAEGFTIHGNVTLGDFCSMRHCLVIFVPGGFDRGIFHWGDILVENCTVAGFEHPVIQFAFDSGTPVFRSTITYRNGVGHSYFSPPFLSFDGSAFWNASANDYHPSPGSPLIDSGSPLSPLDPDGSPADYGAFAYDASFAPEPFTYCVGKLSGQGCVPQIGASGVCSATGTQPFIVSATLVSSDKFGRLFYGPAQAAVPFMGGTRCVSSPFVRTPLSHSGGVGPCAGVLNYDFHACVVSGVDPTLVPGRMVYAQYWYRDPLDPAGFGLGLSNAICFPVAP